VARGRRVVLIGGSRGAEAALLIASYEPRLFDAIVADSPSAYINGAFGGTGAAWTFHGKPLTTGTLIPVANIRVPVLLSDGGHDNVWFSAASATTIVQELRGSGDRAPYTNLYYPDAGHGYAGLPPYLSWTGYGFNGKYIYLGGTEQANALASEQFWPKMIKFINNPSARLK
jgi:dienelactone hydrolase